MFLFSLIPGAGQMYMGFMKQGLSLMTIFATLCAVGIWLDIKPLLFFAPIILLYSFFDATNKNSMDAEAFKKLEDHYLWGDDWMEWSEGLKDSISRRDGKKAMGTVLYIVAACMIWSVVKYFADIIYGPTSLPGAVIAKIPVAVVAVFVVDQPSNSYPVLVGIVSLIFNSVPCTFLCSFGAPVPPFAS